MGSEIVALRRRVQHLHYTSRALLLLALLVSPLFAVAEDALLMGVFPRRNATATSKIFSPLTRYLEAEIGRPIKLMVAKDFPTFWQGVVEKRYDIVHYNQYHYVRSATDYKVIACNVEQGRDVISGALYVRRDSGITDINQLRNHNIIFGGGKGAMMSYIVPRYLLMQGGLKESDYTTSFASNPPNAVLAVYFKQADAGGAGDVVLNLPAVTEIADQNELTYLAISKPLKQLPWAVKRDMPAALQQQIKDLLVQLGSSERGRIILKSAHLNGLNPATDSDYDDARKIIAALPSEN